MGHRHSTPERCAPGGHSVRRTPRLHARLKFRRPIRRNGATRLRLDDRTLGDVAVDRAARRDEGERNSGTSPQGFQQHIDTDQGVGCRASRQRGRCGRWGTDGVDHPVDAVQRGLQGGAVLHCPDDAVDASIGPGLDIHVVDVEDRHCEPSLPESQHDVPADEARTSEDEHSVPARIRDGGGLPAPIWIALGRLPHLCPYATNPTPPG